MEQLQKKKISIVTPCFNEQENVDNVYREVKEIFVGLPQYDYEHIFIDNAPKDNIVCIYEKNIYYWRFWVYRA